jgi:hypothetical protein
MRVIIESAEGDGIIRPSAQAPSTQPAGISGGAAAADTGGTGQAAGFGAYGLAPGSIAADALSASAIDAGPPPQELMDRAGRTSARSPTAAGVTGDRSTLSDGGAAPTH